MRSQLSIEDAAEHLSLSVEEVRTLAAGGALVGTGPYVSRSSVERYAETRRSRAGEYFNAVREVSLNPRAASAAARRIVGATASNVSTAGGDGGLAVPPRYADTLLRPLYSDAGILGRCHRVITDRNTYIAPIDRKPPHASDGIRATIVGEGEPAEQSTPHLEMMSGRLKKLTAVVPVTEELLEDAPFLGDHVLTLGVTQIDYTATDMIVRSGTGVGTPLSILKSPALITVAAEAGPQTAGTIVAANVTKAKARLAATSHATAVALCHPDALEQLPLLNSEQEIYTPGTADAPCGRVLGAAVIPFEGCEAVGTPGDFIFADFSQYALIMREPSLLTLTSLHIWFDQDLTAFKLSFRFDGLPMWAAPIASRVGNQTRSPFVAIAARA